MVLLQASPLPIGQFIAPDFALPATDGKQYTINDFWPFKGLVVIFIENHSPYAQASWPPLIELATTYKLKGIECAAINPNNDITQQEESLEEMKKRVKEWNIPFPYLRDGYQTIARAYGAMCIPDIYLFDANRILYYHGRINDRWQDQTKVTRHDLRDAIESLLAGNPPPKEQVLSMGTSIKWTK